MVGWDVVYVVEWDMVGWNVVIYDGMGCGIYDWMG